MQLAWFFGLINTNQKYPLVQVFGLGPSCPPVRQRAGLTFWVLKSSKGKLTKTILNFNLDCLSIFK